MNGISHGYQLRLSGYLTRLLKLIPGLTILFFFECCERIIDYPIHPGELNLVMNGIINTDSVVLINISKSISILDTGSAPYIHNARVTLYENGALTGLMTYQGKGYYVLNGIKPKIGPEYLVVAVAPDGTEASSTCRIPEPVAIKTVDTIGNIQDNYFSNITHSYDFIITADDPVNIENFYEITVYSKSMYDFYDAAEVKRNNNFSSDDPVFEFYRSGNDVYPLGLDIGTDKFQASGGFFSDALVDGKRFTVRITLEYMPRPGTYFICLRSLTRDYYMYLKSLAQYNMAAGNPFSEPVQIHTNIINGLGIFGGFTNYTDSLYFNTGSDYR